MGNSSRWVSGLAERQSLPLSGARAEDSAWVFSIQQTAAGPRQQCREALSEMKGLSVRVLIHSMLGSIPFSSERKHEESKLQSLRF